jgi:DNA gyrase subunit A
LLKTAVTNGTCDVVLYSSSGKATRFNEKAVRAMGRTARGVRGIRMQEGQHMVDMIIPREGGRILAVSKNGYGKRTRVEEFPVKGRGGQGVIGIQPSQRNGAIVGAVQVFDGDEIMLISDKGTLVRTRVDEISVQGRNTQGVRLIKLKEGETLCGVERVEDPEELALLKPAVQKPVGDALAGDDTPNDEDDSDLELSSDDDSVDDDLLDDSIDDEDDDEITPSDDD